MGFLTDPPATHVWHENRYYTVNPSYDIVLDLQKVYRDSRLNDIDKINTALRMLIVRPKRIHMSTNQKMNLLQAIYDQCIKIPERHSPKNQQKVFDFEFDGEYIYSSFMEEYGIDLIEQRGKLHWKKFLALFQGLSEKTKIREVMKIRSMEIPSPNRHNRKEIQSIMELKSYYALPVQGTGGKQGLDLLFSTLEGMAVQK
jgi:hypothetical protein